MRICEVLTETVSKSLNYNQTMKLIAQVAPLMKQAGINVDGYGLSKILNVTPDYAEHIIQWGINKHKLASDVVSSATANDPISRIALDAFIVKQNGGGLGIERVAKRTGLSEEQVQSIVANNWDQLSQIAASVGLTLKPAFYGNIQRKHVGYDKTKETLASAIRRTMKDITQNFSPKQAASVSAQQIADEIGVDRRTIDNELSNNPELRDLEPFRKLGKRAGMTDADKADRYNRMQYSQ